MRAVITIPEDDQPLLTFSARVRNTDGTLSVIDLTGASMSWISKANEKVDDNTGQTITGVVLGAPTDGNFTVQLTSAVTASAGVYFYKVVVTKNSRPLTVQFGPLYVAST